MIAPLLLTPNPLNMKRISILATTLLTLLAVATRAQVIIPDGYTTTHNDSCWYIALNYYIDDIPSNKQLEMQCCIYCPDTCINDTTRCFQGKNYRKKFTHRNGYTPILSRVGMQRCTLAIPEAMVGDSLMSITTYTFTDKNGTTTEYDSMYIYLPEASPLSCHRVSNKESEADRASYRHRCIYPMAYYEPLAAGSIPPYSESSYAVNFRPASHILENSYMHNINLIDTLAGLIASMTADSLAQIEVVQLVGYSAPDEKREGVGLRRAGSLRDKLKYYCNLPDSVFEVLDGGRNWELIYESIGSGNIAGGDSMVTIFRTEKSPARREMLVNGYLSGDILRQLGSSVLDNQRQACCARIYYRNMPDTIAPRLNRIVNELATNSTPDYDTLMSELQQYSSDARALNLMGVIEYRMHKRNAAKKAFTEAALMGDEQAMTNLMIIARE